MIDKVRILSVESSKCDWAKEIKVSIDDEEEGSYERSEPTDGDQKWVEYKFKEGV